MDKYLTRRLLLAGLLCAAVLCAGLSQNPGVYISSGSEKERAETLLTNLTEGVLIVRLHSDRRKIEELTRLRNAPGTDEKARKRIQVMLDETIAENREENRDIIDAFRLNYDFSQVLFMYDTAVHFIKSGMKSGYFLNEQLEPDPAIVLPSDRWLMIHLRRESPVLFILQDPEFQRVERPFPVPVKPGFGRQAYNLPEGPQRNNTPLMAFSRKKQDRYFSILINNWNGRLKKFRQRNNG